MRILLIADGIWPPSINLSGSKEIYERIKFLAKSGIEVHILTFIERWADNNWKEWMEKEEKNRNVHFHYLEPANLLKYIPSKILWKPLLIPKILWLTLKYKFDLINEFSSSPILLEKSFLYRITYRGPLIASLITYLDGFFGSFNFFSGKYIDKVICITKHQKEIIPIEKNKIEFLSASIDTSIFFPTGDSEFKDNLGILSNQTTILYLGPFEKHKGIFTLAKSIPKVLEKNPNVIFLIVGGILAAASKEFASENHTNHNKNKIKILDIIGKYSDNIIFLEGEQDVSNLMAISDIITVPLNTHLGTLGYPLTLLEAMASESAIVATDIIGINEVITSGKNGLLVPPNDHLKLAEAINKLIENDNFRKKISENARDESKKYDINIIGEKLIKIYEDAIISKNIKVRK